MPTPEATEDLRATESAIQHDAARVADLEQQKAARDPSDPEVLKISHQVEQLAESLHDKATAERALAQEIQAGES